MAPASDIAPHATWKERVGRRQTDGTDDIGPGDRGAELHQGQVLPVVRVGVAGRDHHLSDAMGRLRLVVAVQLVAADVDDVRANVGWTEKGRRRCMGQILERRKRCRVISIISIWKFETQIIAHWNSVSFYALCLSGNETGPIRGIT